MMGPYVAVIRDSFHAALSSRILWVAFLAIWLLLGALSPIGYREDFTTEFRSRDFFNGTRMKAMLAQGLVDPSQQDSPVGRIASAMPDELRRKLERVGQGDEIRIRLSDFADALNELLDDESWYDPDIWASTLRFKELRELDDMDPSQLTDSARRRRARLRIEAALPGVFGARSPRSILLTYAGYDFPANFAVDQTQFVGLINQFVLPVIIGWLLGFVLIFLGILVTASIIPDMLQSGSLHLLLSKPVSRTKLFLSKFLGGCAFVFLCVVQLVIGLYLIAGLRLDIWNARLLWCIPVSVFLFSVYYSVSTFAGLRWRSPILSIAVTTIFGALCLVIGVIGGLFDGLVSRPAAIRQMTAVGPHLFGATRGGGLVRYDESQNQWVEILESDAFGPDRTLPPIPLDDQTLATAQVRGGRFNPFGSGSLDLLVASETDQWEPEPSLRLPTGTTALARAGDYILALNTGELAITSVEAVLEHAGLVEDDSDEKGESSERASDESSDKDRSSATDDTANPDDAASSTGQSQGGSWLSKLSNMIGGATDGFMPILPEQLTLTPPRAILIDPEGKWLIAITRTRLFRLEPTSNPMQRWREVARTTIDGDVARRSVLALADGILMVVRPEEPIRFFDAVSLDAKGELELPAKRVPVSAVGLDDPRRFVLLADDGRCRLIDAVDPGDAQVGEPVLAKEVESLRYDTTTRRLFVAHHIDQLDIIDPTTMAVQQSIRPTLTGWRWTNRYVITPLRFVIPQTGELSDAIAAIISGKSSASIENPSGEEEVIRYPIFRPIVSCAAFIFVMLTISSVYFSTRDF